MSGRESDDEIRLFVACVCARRFVHGCRDDESCASLCLSLALMNMKRLRNDVKFGRRQKYRMKRFDCFGASVSVLCGIGTTGISCI